MADPTGEAEKGTLRLDFDRRLVLEFRGSAITTDPGLLPYQKQLRARPDGGRTYSGFDLALVRK